jgi:signal transduction histidine kinase
MSRPSLKGVKNDEVLRITRQFNDKLHAAFLSLLLIAVALGWFCFDTVNWYEEQVEGIASANSVLRGYQEISDLTLQEINTLGDRLERGESSGPRDDLTSRAEALEKTVSRLRQGIAAGDGSGRNVGENGELATLHELEVMVEEIIRASALIDQALVERRTKDARNEWDRLTSSGIPSDFVRLINSTIEDQILAIQSISKETMAHAQYIARQLPVLISVIVIVSLVLVWLVSRSLTRSLTALRDGTREFSSGNLEHRIPVLKEEEFSRLAQALNTMALELSDHRKRSLDTTTKLEAMVDERTQALKFSNDKLAEVDVTRRKFLADISHEFRTPLTVIRGESDIALRGANKTEAEYREAIQRILDQADHATHLVDDLLFIARADAGEPRLKLGLVSIANLVHSLCNEFDVTARQKGIAIKMHTKDVPAVIYGDAGRLRQVFAILMDNALRYSKPGGNIEVSVSVAHDRVQVSFRDYGIGLTDEDAELAFERFYRGRKAQEHAGGTGLGLPVAKAIVEAHNGSISLKGKLGAGATATVTLPVTHQFKVVA